MEWTCTQSKGLRWGEFELHSRETKGSRVQPFANAVRDGLGISLIIACLVLRQAFEHCVEVAVDAVICDLSFWPRRAPLLTNCETGAHDDKMQRNLLQVFARGFNKVQGK